MSNLPSRRLYREENGAIAGVAAGLAEYLGLPTSLIRVLFLILFFAGPGLPLYVLFWILTPRGEGKKYSFRSGVGLPLLFVIGVVLILSTAISLPEQIAFPGALVGMLGLFTGLTFLMRSRREEGLSELELTNGLGAEPIRLQFESEAQPTIQVEDEGVSYNVTMGTQKKIAGVCAYLSDKTGMDVTLVRVIAIVLSFFTFPIVPILYLVGAFVLPKQEKLRIH
ncbi:MAG: PspC domain-containing protein [Ignavibacteriae bacterium]|nr:PspC domain-containing protein [Ignavibacteriota bacterium]MCB9216087.1 PspC domain-containing protein [Ignavibacteria bacterium]